jgi:hypothetical protein
VSSLRGVVLPARRVPSSRSRYERHSGMPSALIVCSSILFRSVTIFKPRAGRYQPPQR